MRARMLPGAALLLLAWLPVSAVSADAARGEALHRACLSCHGTELYLPPKRKITSLSGLKKEVERWNDMYNPKMTKREVQDLVEYLNRDFYKFGK